VKGDFIRAVSRYGSPGKSLHWQVHGRGKRSITLNLRSAGGQAVFKKLASWADLLVENMRPGTMGKWGLGYEDLAKVNPRLVYLSVSGWGQTGPYRDRTSYEFAAAAFGGLTYLTGFPDRPPVLPGLAVMDHTAGMFGLIGALEAVRRRDAQGPERAGMPCRHGPVRAGHADVQRDRAALRGLRRVVRAGGEHPERDTPPAQPFRLCVRDPRRGTSPATRPRLRNSSGWPR
jgi:crotonobetainyl-CoA:carnitine CoA-transferase CaiB-like acyl-CoA transferase